MMSAYLSGFFISFSLILAIGAQNAFVLRQGIKQQHVFLVCLMCAMSDAILIVLGVVGFSRLIEQAPWVETVARYGGAAFLIVYGTSSLMASFRRTDYLAPATEGANRSLYKTIITCLALTWLNPHVYLDTVIFIGSISAQFTGMKIPFTLGAVSASFVFFFSLGYGAKLLIPLFRQVITWKILDFFVGLLMFVLAFSFLYYD